MRGASERPDQPRRFDRACPELGTPCSLLRICAASIEHNRAVWSGDCGSGSLFGALACAGLESGYPNGSVRPLLRRDSAEKRDIAAARIVNGCVQVRWNAVMYGPDEVGIGDWPPLVIGDRDQRHIAKANVERLEVGKVLPAVQSRHRAICHLVKQREMKLLDMPTRRYP